MRRMRLIHALALTVGAALVLSACGGDDSPEQPIVVPTTSSSSALATDEFISEADAICLEANTAIGQFVASGQGFTAAGEIADLRQGVLDEINNLGAPDEDRTTLDGFLTGLQGQVEAGQKIALANERGSDTAEFETELDAAQSETAAAAEAYGFTECGQESSTGATTTNPSVGPVTPSEPVTPAPVAPDTSSGGTGDSGGTDDSGGVSPGGGVGPG